MQLNRTSNKYDEERYLSQFVSECLILCSKILLDVLQNASLRVVTSFQTSILLKAFWATLGVSFLHLHGLKSHTPQNYLETGSFINVLR